MASPLYTDQAQISQEEIEFNQAILNSMHQQTPQSLGQLPQPTWNNGTQFVPLQTTTNYVPVPQRPVPISFQPPSISIPRYNQIGVPGSVKPPLVTYNQAGIPISARPPMVTYNQPGIPGSIKPPIVTYNQVGIPGSIKPPMVTYNQIPGSVRPPIVTYNQVGIPGSVRSPIVTYNPVGIPGSVRPPMLTIPNIPRVQAIPITQPQAFQSTAVPIQPFRPTPIQTQLFRPPVGSALQVPARAAIYTQGMNNMPNVPPLQLIGAPPVFPPAITIPVRPIMTGIPTGILPQTMISEPELIAPQTNLPPIQPVTIIPRSPARMTPDEEDEMRLAIIASLEQFDTPIRPASPQTQQLIRPPTFSPRRITNVSPLSPRMNNMPFIMTPPRNPLYSPEVEEEDEVEEILMRQAIEASRRSMEQARLATVLVNQVANVPLSPRTIAIQEGRIRREEQDREYEEALRKDIEREAATKRDRDAAVEAANKAAIAAEEATNALQLARTTEDARKDALQPPVLVFPIEDGDGRDNLTLRFRLPQGGNVNHSFNKKEPLRSIIQQLRFDTKHLGDFVLTISPRTAITCSADTTIDTCGIQNRTLILVTLP